MINHTQTTNTELPFIAEMAEYEKAGYTADYCLALSRWCLWNEPELAEELRRACEREENWPDSDSPEIEQQMVTDFKRICYVARARRDQYDPNWIIANAY